MYNPEGKKSSLKLEARLGYSVFQACVCACEKCVRLIERRGWKDPQHSVVCRPNQCQYVNENCDTPHTRGSLFCIQKHFIQMFE